jgi:hypothetical protein
MKMTVSLVCETSIAKPRDGRPITRDDITCRIIYCSTSKYLSDGGSDVLSLTVCLIPLRS